MSKNTTSSSAPGSFARKPRIGLKDLAAHLRLSQSTVSRVISNSAAIHRIAVETQQRVLKAAAEMNYKPNVVARSLRKKQSFTIGVMVPEISEGYAASVLGGIEEALLSEKFFYFVVSHHHLPELLLGYPHLLLSRAVEGIIAVDTPIREELPVPIVAVSGHSRKSGMVTIELDHLTAARYALSHLAELGHRKIAFIKGQSFSSDTNVRWKAIRQVSAGLGISVDSELVVQLEGIEPGSDPGYQAMQKLLARGVRFTALFAFNDASAIGAIAALHDAGLHVPRDVSVVGFDDIPGAATVHPALTTVRQPLREMGRAAAVNLLRLIRKEDGFPVQRSILVAPGFIKRRSTNRISS